MTILTISGQCQSYVPVEKQEESQVQYIERWKISDKEICLLRKNEELFYEILDTLTNKYTQGLINIEGNNIDNVISYLSNCGPEVSESGKEIIFLPKTPCPYILRWIINDNEVCLIRKDHQLSYVAKNFAGKSFEGFIPLDGHKIENVISYLFVCQPEIAKIGEINFVPKPLTHYTWTFRNKEIQLLQKNDNLIWQLFDKSTNTISQTPFQTSVLSRNSMAIRSVREVLQKGMSDTLKRKTDKALKLCLKNLEDCEIEKLEIKSTSQFSHQLNEVFTKEISGKSQLDPKIPINRKSWAVTLVNSGASRKFEPSFSLFKKEIIPNPFTWGGHAAVIIEGRKKGAFFSKKAHFYKNRDGLEVISLDDHLNYTQKGETWKVSRSNVKNMLKAIKDEIERLRPWQERQMMRKHDKKNLQKVSSSEGKDDPPYFFDILGSESKLIKPIVIREYSSYDELIKEVPYRSITLVDRNGIIGNKDNEKSNAMCVEQAPSQQMFIQDPSTEKWKEVRVPDNCFTWAKKKLKYCGIYLEGDTLNPIIATPKMYLALGSPIQDGFSRKVNRSKHRKNNKKLTPLMQAIHEGQIEKIKELVAKGVDLNSKNEQGFNPFHLACVLGNIRVATFLSQKGMDVHEPTEDPLRTTPLFWAIINNHKSLIDLLVNSGLKINKQDSQTGNTILHLLSEFYSSDYRSYLAPDFVLEGNVNTENSQDETPLILAVQNKKIEMARQLLQNQASVNHKDKKLHTPFWYAYENEDVEMMSLLIGYGASLNENSFLETAVKEKKSKIVEWFLKKGVTNDLNKKDILWEAYKNDDEETARLLIKYGTNVNEIFFKNYRQASLLGSIVNALLSIKYSPLEAAIKDNALVMARLFLKSGAKVLQKNEDGHTPLRQACEHNDGKMANLLIEFGADAKEKDLFQTIVKHKKFEIARVFLQNGACINMPDSHDKTAFDYAYKKDDEKMISLFIEFDDKLNKNELFQTAVKNRKFKTTQMLLQKSGIAINNKDDLGKTALSYACENEDEMIANLLIEYGADHSIVLDKKKKYIHSAVKDKKITILRLLLQNGASVNEPDDKGLKPLWYAYDNKDVETMRLLIEYGADISNVTIHSAVKNNKITIVRLLLQNGASANEPDDKGIKPLWYAYTNGDEEMMHLLSEYGAEKSVVHDKKNIFPAVKEKKLAIVRLLLQNGASANEPNVKDRKPLWYAYNNKDEETMRLLIEHGANVNEIFYMKFKKPSLSDVIIAGKLTLDLLTPKGKWIIYTPLEAAIKDGRLSAARLFLESGANIAQKDKMGNTPIWQAYHQKDEEMIGLLIEFGAGMNEDKLFHRVVKDRQLKIVHMLLQKNKAFINKKDGNGKTALYNACLNEDVEMVDLLIEYGAIDNSIVLDKTNTFILSAIKAKKRVIVHLLLQNGASANEPDDQGLKPLWHAYIHGDEEMMRLLIKYGADVNKTCSDKAYRYPHHPARPITFLHAAVRYNQLEKARLVLESGAIVDYKDENGFTPFWHAYHNGNKEMILLLSKWGAKIDRSWPKDKKLEMIRWFTQNTTSVDIKHLYAALVDAYSHDDEKFNLLIDHGIDPEVAFKERLETLTASHCRQGQ